MIKENILNEQCRDGFTLQIQTQQHGSMRTLASLRDYLDIHEKNNAYKYARLVFTDIQSDQRRANYTEAPKARLTTAKHNVLIMFARNYTEKLNSSLQQVLNTNSPDDSRKTDTVSIYFLTLCIQHSLHLHHRCENNNKFG